MPEPTLHLFAISHYCEKACWALDRLGVDHRVQPTAPGLHVRLAKKLGLSRSSLPILVVDGQPIQGSSEIIDWAETLPASGAPPLTPDDAREECLAIESRLDRVVGVHLRRTFYSRVLLDHPEMVRPIFTRGLPLSERLVVRLGWGSIRARMIDAMDLGPRQGDESRQIVEGELDWLEERLADGRRHLLSGRFTRADLTAASLLAPLARPQEHRVYSELPRPPGFAAEIAEWEERPVVRWVRETYSRERFPARPRGLP